MTEFTYSTLLSTVQQSLEETDSAMTSFLDSALEIVESKLSRRLDSISLVSIAYCSMVTANPYVVKPTGHIVTRRLSYRTSNGWTQLNTKNLEFLDAYWPDRTSTGTPTYYGNYGDDYLLVVPPDGTGRELEMEFEVRASALSSLNPTNWYTKHAGAALYAGLMAEGNKYLKNFEAAAFWDAEFEKEVSHITRDGPRERRSNTANNKSPSTTNNRSGVG